MKYKTTLVSPHWAEIILEIQIVKDLFFLSAHSAVSHSSA